MLKHSHRENKTYANSKEFLSGITREDRLIPVITIVVFLNSTHWDGPKSLHEMLHIENLPEELIKRIPDYELIIVSPDLLEKEDLEKMTSSAGYVLGAIKHSYSGENFKSYIEHNKEVLKAFPNYAAVVINEFCSIKMNENELKKEVVNMCQAIIDIKAEGHAEGRMEGRMEGRAEGMFIILCNLLEDGIITLDQAAQRMDVEPEEFLKKQKELTL